MTDSQTRFSPNRFAMVAANRITRRGLTLIEIMIALTMTLIVLGAMMSAFRYASEKMQMGRGVMEMANRLRSAEELLRNDLANLTLDPRPYTESATPNGFLEIIEGANNDSTYSPIDPVTNEVDPERNYLGDVDDSIGMTVRSADGRKFRGTVGGAVVESTLAEVWYFTTLSDLASSGLAAADGVVDIDIEDSVRLHRRALLIRPDLPIVGGTGLTIAQASNYVRNNDISVRVVPDGGGGYSIVANTLADLALRKNRFAHLAPTDTNHNFPNSPTAILTIARLKPNGEDILLSDVAGFDVRVYSPNATVGYTAGDILVQPGDSGYVATIPGTPIVANRVGAFVDLGYGVGITGVDKDIEWFSDLPTAKSLLSTGSRVYDSWSPSYEHDGIDQDGANGVDQGTNGINDTVAGGTAAPDDDAERETRPPYPYPVRGIQISTRLIEKTTQQVHQSSVIQSYVPE